MILKNERVLTLVDGIILALQFLTVIPIKKEVAWDKKRARLCVIAFPVVGMLLGMLLVLQYELLKHYSPFSLLSITFWLFFFSVLFSGGLHLDGWMDASDAYFSYRDKEKRLEIMKDSRVGAFGVLSVIFLLGWRFLFLYEVIHMDEWFISIVLFMIPFLSRMLMGLHLIHGLLVKKEGMAYAFREHVRPTDSAYYLFYLVSSFVIIGFITSFQFIVVPILLLFASIIFYFINMRFITHQFGGITGDLVGASVEGGETWLWMIVWLSLYFGMG